MAYPDNKPSGNYKLRDYDFATLDDKKIPMDEYLFKNGYKNAEESEVESVPDAHEQNWLFDVLHRNLKYTLETAEENKTLLATKVATPTSIGQVKIGYGLEVTTGGVLSVTKGIAEDANIISYDLPVGSYMLWAGNQPPEYFIKPSGQTLLRSAYPELWEFAQDNNLIGKLFEAGDGQTTFLVKDIQNALDNPRQLIKSQEPTGNDGRWFNLYSDGWYEEGITISNSEVNPLECTLTRAYKNKNYNVFVNTDNKTDNPRGFSQGYKTITNKTFKVYSGYCTNEGVSYGLGGNHTIWSTSGYTDLTEEEMESSKGVISNLNLSIILKALPTPPSNAVPTGTIIDYTGKVAPDGYIIANGAELSRKTFSKLFQWASANGLIKPQLEIPATAHGFYGDGDGLTTFTIPDLRGVFKRSADLASNRGSVDVGIYQEDGLPNVKSSNIGADAINEDGTNHGRHKVQAPFYYPDILESTVAIKGGGPSAVVSFDLSRANPIYGKADQVQPKSVSILPILKY